jgi:hypothetical protein
MPRGLRFCQDCWWRFTTVFRYESLVGLADPEDEAFRLLYSVGKYWPVDTASHPRIVEFSTQFLFLQQMLLAWLQGSAAMWMRSALLRDLMHRRVGLIVCPETSVRNHHSTPHVMLKRAQSSNLNCVKKSFEFSNCLIESTKFITNFEKVCSH